MIRNVEVIIDDRQDIKISEKIKSSMEKAVEEVLILERDEFNYEVSISLVDNEEIKRLNKEFRKVDSETDVLSFPIVDELFPDVVTPMLGDIIISVEKALDQSKEYGHDLKREIIFLTVHSMFHLLGYNHIEEDERKIMRAKEDYIMDKIDIKR